MILNMGALEINSQNKSDTQQLIGMQNMDFNFDPINHDEIVEEVEKGWNCLESRLTTLISQTNKELIDSIDELKFSNDQNIKQVIEKSSLQQIEIDTQKSRIENFEKEFFENCHKLTKENQNCLASVI